MSEFLATLVDYAWGMPLIILLMGGGLYLVFVSRFIPLMGFVHAIKLVSGKYHHEGDEKDEGQISHFQALTNALASTVGMANVAGVAVAITQGGPGAVFWMWIAALIGMNTKFFECSLAVMYRGRDYTGEVQGGPMYVIEKALGKKWKPLAIAFAIFGMFGMMPLFNMNQLTSYTYDQFHMPRELVGLIAAVFVSLVLMGGIKSIGRVTSKVVPLMCVIYVVSCLVIVFSDLGAAWLAIEQIFTEALGLQAATGGAVGYAFAEIMKTGVKRAAFSNEAGIGSAPMAHSNVKTSEPISEGLVAMLGPFLDTIIVCTLTAVTILVAVDPTAYKGTDINGILLTSNAFSIHYPTMGPYLLGVVVLLFAVSTVLGTANYMQKCWNYLFRGRFGLGNKTFIAVYAVVIMVGAIADSGDVINFLDINFAFMAIPNMIATLILAPKVKSALKVYWSKI